MIQELKDMREKLINLYKKNTGIRVTQELNFLKVEINDFINKKDRILYDKYNLKNLIKSSILFDEETKEVNKGTYYIIKSEDKLYNILFNDTIITINETQTNNDIQEEKYIQLNKDSENYKYYSYKKNNNNGFSHKKSLYKTDKFVAFLEFDEKEAKEEINVLMNNLKCINGIDELLNFELLEKIILNTIKQKQKQL